MAIARSESFIARLMDGRLIQLTEAILSSGIIPERLPRVLLNLYTVPKSHQDSKRLSKYYSECQLITNL